MIEKQLKVEIPGTSISISATRTTINVGRVNHNFDVVSVAQGENVISFGFNRESTRLLQDVVDFMEDCLED